MTTQNPAQDVSDQYLGAAFREVWQSVGVTVEASCELQRMYNRARELQQSSAPVVGDAMLDRACKGFVEQPGDTKWEEWPDMVSAEYLSDFKKMMRAALESALTGRGS